MSSRKIENNQKKVIAHDYFRQGFSQIEIASKIGVSQQTLSRWVKQEGWRDERTSLTQTRQALLKQYHDQLSELNRIISLRNKGHRMPTKPEADVMTQLLNAIQKLENEASISQTISVFTDLLDFVRLHAPDKVIALSDLCDAFIKSKL